MKERPILFSAPMVRAILSGVKTQTRRVYKPKPGFPFQDGEITPTTQDSWMEWGPCPYGEHGDRLWVKETWNYQGWSSVWENGGRRPYDELFVKYRADDVERTIHRKPDDNHGLPKQRARRQGEDEEAYNDYLTQFWRKWTPSIFMPRDVSRITLEIVSVRVERLQDISEGDAVAEGCEMGDDGFPALQPNPRGGHDGWDSAADWYAWLWESINGAGSWDANPWVWVVEFKRI